MCLVLEDYASHNALHFQYGAPHRSVTPVNKTRSFWRKAELCVVFFCTFSYRRMKLLLTALAQTHRSALCSLHRRCRSSSARCGLSSPREDALIVGSSPELLQRLSSQVEVRTSFITEEEEGAFLRELEPGLKKKRYEYDHWDDVRISCLST